MLVLIHVSQILNFGHELVMLLLGSHSLATGFLLQYVHFISVSALQLTTVVPMLFLKLIDRIFLLKPMPLLNHELSVLVLLV